MAAPDILGGGEEQETPTRAVFVDLGDGRLVLYPDASKVPAVHAKLKTVPAERDSDGSFVPKARRKR